MSEALMPFVYENVRWLDEEIAKTQRALAALYKHREEAIQPIIDIARLTPPVHMVDPLKRTVGGTQAPCLSGDQNWRCGSCNCWKLNYHRDGGDR